MSSALVAFFSPQNVLAQTCVELNNCPKDVPPLTYYIFPYTEIFGDYIYVIVWGSVIAVIYIRTQNGILASMVGLVIASILTGTSTVLSNTTTNGTLYWGLVMVGLSFASAAFFLIRSRAANP